MGEGAQLEVTEEQVLYFRARRGGLVGGAENAVAAARSIIGGQAQQEAPALLALSQRSTTRPTALDVQSMLWEEKSLIRTWGQRDTVHVYAIEDWPLIVAARREWAAGGRRGAMPTAADLDVAREVLEAHDGPLTRKDMYAAVSPAFVEATKPIAEKARQEPLHFAAGRLIWQLSNEGDLCTVYKQDKHQAYAYRKTWCPDLPWPEDTASIDAIEAAATLARRYLQVYGPATIQDIGHFFNARLKEVRGWMALLHEQNALMPVTCEDREDLWLCVEDEETLREAAPTTAKAWPVRLLPLWDSMLMGHADKRWTVPDEAERKLIWKKAAMVCAVVLARGRIVGTWTQKARKKCIDVKVTPLSGWRTRSHKAAVTREAQAVAAHMGREEASVVVL